MFIYRYFFFFTGPLALGLLDHSIVRLTSPTIPPLFFRPQGNNYQTKFTLQNFKKTKCTPALLCRSVWVFFSCVGLCGCRFCVCGSVWVSVFVSVCLGVLFCVGLFGCPFLRRSIWVSVYASVYLGVRLCTCLFGRSAV